MLKIEAIVPVRSLVKCLPFVMGKLSHFWGRENCLIKNFESGITNGWFSEKGKLSPQVHCCIKIFLYKNAGKVISVLCAHAEGKLFSPLVLTHSCLLPKMGC